MSGVNKNVIKKIVYIIDKIQQHQMKQVDIVERLIKKVEELEIELEDLQSADFNNLKRTKGVH